jgi:amidohydrolase family protein
MSLMQRSVDAFNSGDKDERRRMNVLYQSFVLDNFSREKMVAIAQVLKRNDTHVVPTLATLKGIYFINDTSFTNDPRKRYMSTETLDYWKDVTDSDLKNNTALEWQLKRKRWQVEKQIMQILIKEKVSLMAGTDSDNPYAFPGFSLHDEIALYVELGMTPIEALRSATTVPAEFLQLSDSLGTVDKGKLADMVILDKDPLDDIRHSSTIHAVIANGKVYDKSFVDNIINEH